MDLQLRYATIDDAAIIAHFAGKTFYETYAWYNNEEDMAEYINKSFNTRQIAAELTDPQSAFLLVFNDSQICGYAKLVRRHRPDNAHTEEPALEIARLYTNKELIGKGIGKIMMEACIAYAKKENATSIWLDVWKENKKAIRFYEKWGFEIVCDWHFALGKDTQSDFIMQKQL